MKTREEFRDFLLDEAKKMYTDKELQRLSAQFLSAADKHSWIHQTTWLGEPSLQLPQDLFSIQEVFVKIRPKIVIESGVAWGGTALFLMTLAQSLYDDNEWLLYVGVDKQYPNEVAKRLAEMIEEKTRLIEGCSYGFIEGDSCASTTHDEIIDFVDYFYDYSKEFPSGSRWANESKLVILDSHHTHDHVLKELEVYSKNYNPEYIIVCDTIIEDIENPSRERPWGPGNSPRTAIREFLSKNDDYEVDESIRNKLLLSCQPDGYLKRKNL